MCPADDLLSAMPMMVKFDKEFDLTWYNFTQFLVQNEKSVQIPIAFVSFKTVLRDFHLPGRGSVQQ